MSFQIVTIRTATIVFIMNENLNLISAFSFMEATKTLFRFKISSSLVFKHFPRCTYLLHHHDTSDCQDPILSLCNYLDQLYN